MALRAKVLRIKAEKFEVKKLQVYQVNKERISALEPFLEEVYINRKPKPVDYEVRRDLVHVFNDIAKEIYGNSKDIPVVVEFGSFVMDLFSSSSDLDLSVNFNTNAVAFPREKKIQTLRKFAKKLYALKSKGHVTMVLPVTTAKVPILKCVDRGTGVECDISVENRDGILKSQLIHIISSVDERFKKLSFLMKIWAKAYNINSSKDKTLNSLSIILLVAFHLQTRNPPILPPFSAMFKDGTEPAIVTKSLRKFANYGKSNGESLAELFLTLLIKLCSVEKLWAKGLCASACDASWTSKTWDSKVASISVEDFTDRSQNVARAVGQAEVKRIYKCVNLSIQYLVSFMNGHIEGTKLRDLLFGQDGIRSSIPKGPPNSHPTAALPCSPSQANRCIRVAGKKRKRTMPLESVPMQGITHTKNCAATQSGSGKQVGQAIPLEERWTRTARSTSLDHKKGGWEGTQWPSAGQGWEGAKRPSSKTWGGTQWPNAGQGWGGTEKPSSENWGGTKWLSAGGWEGTQRSTVGGWGGT